ncbi:hypothetical protein OHT75_07675, partial [Shewanella sp. FYR11-62]|nr:hypothetical protein [Shewanella subflava]
SKFIIEQVFSNSQINDARCGSLDGYISLGMVWSYSLFLAKQIITPYHAAQKVITKDQHALAVGLVII